MRFTSACALVIAGTLLAGPSSVQGQVAPNNVRQRALQRTTPVAPPVPTVMRPTEGEIVAGDLAITVQVPPQVLARKYTIEAAYWDPARNNWFYPGTLGPDFKGGTTATTRVAADVRQRLNAKATRWKIHVRVTDPPGSWGLWREFIWQAASAGGATAATTTATPATVPTNTTTLPAGQGTTPGIMVPGTAGQNPPKPGAPTSPPAGQGTTPGIMVPGTAGQNPPKPGAPTSPGTPPTPLPSATPPSVRVPAVQQPPAQPTLPPAPAGQPVPQTPPPSLKIPPPITAPTLPPAAPPAPQKPPTLTPPQPPPPAPTAGATAITRQPVLPATGAIKSGVQKTPPSGQMSRNPGGNPINIASRTTLQVWTGRPAVDNLLIFVPGPVDVDWTKSPLPWWFQITTTAPNAVPGKGRWEMSRTPFGDSGAFTPYPGFGYTGPVDAVEFVINLDPYAPRPPDWRVTVQKANQPAPTLQAKGGASTKESGSTKERGGTLPPTFSQASSLPADLRIPQPGKGRQASSAPMLPPTLPSTLPVSLSLYVRVVPLDKSGKDADLPSNAVELRFGPAEAAPAFNMDPKYWPAVSFVYYRPVQGYTFDWQCWVKAAKDIKAPDFFGVGINPGTTDTSIVLYHAGETRDTCDSGNSIVDDFLDALGGFVDMLKSFVNWVSTAYNSIKEFAVSTVVSIIPGCSDSPVCQLAVQAGLNTGLAALGMPPGLPDFDQLEAMGEGYLVDAIAQQVAAQTNLPFAEDAAKAAVKEMIDKGKQALSGGSGSSAWIPDDSKQYKPLFVTFAVSNPSTTGHTPAMYLELSEPGGSRYNPTTVAVPGLAPGKSIKVAIALKPVKDPKAWMELLPTAADYSNDPFGTAPKLVSANKALHDWRVAYMTGTVNLRARIKLPPFVGKTAWESSCFAEKPGCLLK